MPGRGTLVGRAEELARLEEAFADARLGRGSVALIAGEPGIGKTRLVEECARLAREQGARFAWGRCWDGGGAPAFHPFREVERELGWDETTLDAIGESPEARFRQMDGFCRRIREAARATPIVLALDDLQWSDASSWSLLRLLARDVRRARVLLLCTYRDAETRVQPELSSALADAGREGMVMHLEGLRGEALAELVRISFEDAPAAVVDRIGNATRGNPFFAAELAAQLAREPGRELPLPDGVRVALERRLLRFDAESQRVLAVAALAGREVSASRIARLGACSRGYVEALLARGVDEGVLAPAGALHAFRHDLIREVLAASLSPSERAVVHTAIADELQARDRPEELDALAHHLVAARDPRAVEVAERAARRSLRGGAFEIAVTHAEGALRVCEEAGTEDSSRECELLLLVGEARIGAGDVRAGREICDRAAARGRAERRGDVLARAALAYAMPEAFGRVEPDVVARLEEALSCTVDRNTALRARLLARLAAAMQPASDPARPLAMAHDAVEMARGTGDRQLLLATIDGARAAYRPLDDLDRRTALDREAAELAASLGDRRALARARGRLVCDLQERCEGDAADALMLAHDAAVAELGAPDHTLRAAIARCVREIGTGHFDAALARLHELRHQLARWGELGERLAPAAPIAFLRLVLLLARGRYDEPAGLAASPMEGPFGIAMMAGVAGMVIDDIALRGAYQRLLASGPSLQTTFAARTALVAACLRLRDATTASQLHALLRPFARRAVTSGIYGAIWGSVARLLGCLSSVAGDLDAAVVELHDAIELESRLGALPYVAQSKHALAGVLRQRGGRGDHERATELSREAREVFRALDMPAYLVETHDEGAEGRSPAKPPAPRSPGDEAVHIVADGATWLLTGRGESARVQDADGPRYLSYLLTHPNEEVPAWTLLEHGRRPRPERRAGDAGPLLDGRARAAYRRRLEELRADLAEAEEWHDVARAEALRGEMGTLAHELARASGLGGRERKAGAASERARVNATLRIRKAIARIGEQAPSIAHHLQSCVRTGATCAYRPEPKGRRVTS